MSHATASLCLESLSHFVPMWIPISTSPEERYLALMLVVLEHIHISFLSVVLAAVIKKDETSPWDYTVILYIPYQTVLLVD